MGGGGFSGDSEARLTPMDRYIIALSPRDEPKVCFLPTASGDAAGYIDNFYAAFREADCRPVHCSLFDRGAVTLDDELADVDIFYVGGGNTMNLLALWRLHGLDRVFSELREPNTVFAGVSAGAMCWFEAGLTDSMGPQMAPLSDGLGWLSGSFCPHFDSNPPAETAYRGFIEAGDLPAGYGVDEGVALHFINGDLLRAVSEVAGAAARRVRVDDSGVHYQDLEVELLV